MFARAAAFWIRNLRFGREGEIGTTISAIGDKSKEIIATTGDPPEEGYRIMHLATAAN